MLRTALAAAMCSPRRDERWTSRGRRYAGGPTTTMPAMARSSRRLERKALVQLLQGGRAHLPLLQALRAFPAARAGERPRGAPHSAWQLVEHLRIAQRDMLDFGRDADHASPPFPDGYWPATVAPPHARAYAASVRAFARDLARLIALAEKGRDLGDPLPGTITSWFGLITLAAGHNAYHLGQLVLLQKLLPPRRVSSRARRRS